MSRVLYTISLETSDYMRTTYHWHRNRLKNRAETIRDLIQIGLKVSEDRFREEFPEIADKDEAAIRRIKETGEG